MPTFASPLFSSRSAFLSQYSADRIFGSLVSDVATSSGFLKAVNACFADSPGALAGVCPAARYHIKSSRAGINQHK
jgi:hypothetical protein